MKRIILLIIILYINLDILYGCSIIYSPNTEFSKDEYVFIGQVINYIGPIEADRINGILLPNRRRMTSIYNGIFVKLLDEIYVPIKPDKYYEVFPYSLGSDCSFGSFSKADLIKDYPIGSEIIVIGKITEHLFFEINEGDIRLDILPTENHLILLNKFKYDFIIATKQSEWDYSLSKYLRDQIEFDKFCNSKNIHDSDTKDNILWTIDKIKDFEINKDLYRLYISQNDTIKSKIIQRMSNFEFYYPDDIIKIIDSNIKDKNIKSRLLNRIFYKSDRKNEPIFRH